MKELKEKYAKEHDWYKKVEGITRAEYNRMPLAETRQMVLDRKTDLYYKKDYAGISDEEFSAGLPLQMAADIDEIKKELKEDTNYMRSIAENTKIMKYIMIGFAALTALNVICTIYSAIKIAIILN